MTNPYKLSASRSKRLPEKWPCVFREPYVREIVDPRVQAAWLKAFRVKAPFGALRTLWRRDHCATINPYGSDHCPYLPEECALAFLQTVQSVAAIGDPRNPRGWFSNEARRFALNRVDSKPLARDNHRTDVSQRPRDPRAVREDSVERHDPDAPAWALDQTPDSDLRRSDHRPQRIGDLLGQINLRTRQGPSDDGKESTE